MHPLKYVHFVSLQYYCSTSQKIPMAHPQDPCCPPPTHSQQAPPPTERAQSRRLGGVAKKQRGRERKKMATGYVTGVTADDEHPSRRLANVPTGFPTRMSYIMNSHRLRSIDNRMKRDKDFNVPGENHQLIIFWVLPTRNGGPFPRCKKVVYQRGCQSRCNNV